MSTYVALIILYPLINLIINNISKQNYLMILFIGFLYVAIRPVFLLTSTNSLILFIYLYMIGAYIRKYDIVFFLDRELKINLIAWLCIILFVLISIYLYNLTKNRLFLKSASYPMANYSAFMLFLSTSFFMYIKNKIRIKNRTINIVSSHTLGIYLIHEHIILKDFIWNDIFPLHLYINSSYFYPIFFFCAIVLFLSSLIIDCIRKELINIGIIKKILDFCINKISCGIHYTINITISLLSKYT